jgi:cell division protein FtsN
MDMYAMTLLGLMAAVLVLTIIGTVQAVVSNRKAFNKVVAKSATATPFNYEQWQAERIAANKRKAKAIAEFQELRELNADFSAVIEGE